MQAQSQNGLEYVLDDADVIITHTDLQSRITYANDAFVRSSGYSREECMGQPQNLVRHPDMPKVAFRDLWRTIKAGRSWTGLVKNRRKNGGFYWVRANVSPIVSDGRRIGYLSVRVKPNQGEVAAAEALYRRINSGNAAGVSLDGGVVTDRSPIGILRSLMTLPTSVVVPVALLVFAALFAWLGVAAAGTVRFAGPVCFAGAGASLALAVFVRLRLTAALRAMTDIAKSIVEGDMRISFPGYADPDATALSGRLNQLNAKLKGVMTDTRGAVQAMLGGVGEIVTENVDMSNRVGESAASLEETAASVEELHSTVKSNAESAAHATALVQEATEITVRGGKMVAEVAAAMSGIAGAAHRIAEIVTVIDGIAFQTNLLALNASVEAARAGEHGRGFAIVAQEVRNLAQRCATAAKDIRGLAAESVATTGRGQSLVGQAEQTMKDVVRAVGSVTTVMQEMSGANREQAEGVGQINTSILQLDETTQRNAHMAQNMARVAESLQDQAGQVMRVLSAFAVRGTDQRAGGEVAPASAAQAATDDDGEEHALTRAA